MSDMYASNESPRPREPMGRKKRVGSWGSRTTQRVRMVLQSESRKSCTEKAGSSEGGAERLLRSSTKSTRNLTCSYVSMAFGLLRRLTTEMTRSTRRIVSLRTTTGLVSGNEESGLRAPFCAAVVFVVVVTEGGGGGGDGGGRRSSGAVNDKGGVSEGERRGSVSIHPHSPSLITQQQAINPALPTPPRQ